MTAQNHRSEYSRPWLGRLFVLTDESLAWGRYVIRDSTFAETSHVKRRQFELIIKQTEPGLIAAIFEHLLHVYCPGTFPNFLSEIQALATYHYSKEHLNALLRNGCAPGDYLRARAATVSAFDQALTTVFESSTPLHGLSGLNYVRYRQKLHGMHLTTFADNQHKYDVAFTPDLVLSSIHLDSNWIRIWP